MAKKFTIDVEAKTNAQDVQKQFGDLRKSINDTKESIEGLDKSSANYEKEVRELNAELEKLEGSYKDLNKANTDLGASFEDVHGEMKPLTGRMGEMEDRLYEMGLAGNTASKEYHALLVEVGKYKKVQQDTDMIVDAAATTMAQKMGGALQGVAGGFAVTQASMALFGSESEEIEKTMLKVQSAMALVQGMEGLREGAKAFKAMGVQAKIALGGIRKGIIATGVGAFVVLLGAAVAYWDEISAFIDAGAGKAKKLNEEYDKGVTLLKAQKEQTDLKVQIMEAEGATAEEIHKVRLGILDTEIELAKRKIEIAKFEKKNDIERAKRNKKILTLVLQGLLQPIELIIFTYNKVASTLNLSRIPSVAKSIANAVFDISSVTNQANQAVTDAENNLDKLQKQRKLMNIKFNKQQKASAKTSIETANQRKDDLLAIEREIEDKRSAIRKESEMKDILIAERTAEREKEDLDIRLRDKKISDKQYFQFKKISEAKLNKVLKDINNKYRGEEKAAEEARLKNIKDIRDQFLNTLEEETNINNRRVIGEKEFELQQVKDKYNLLLAQAKEYNIDATELVENREAAIQAIEKKYEDQEKIDRDKQTSDDIAMWNARVQVANDALGAINGLIQALADDNEKSAKRAFDINKAVGIAQAIMSTAQGIMNAYANPVDVASGMSFAKSAIIATTGAAQVATIASQQFQTSGGSTGDSPSSPNAPTGGNTTPQFNVVGNSNVNQLAQLQMQPTKAFVVSGDVSTAQALDRNKIQNATI